MGNSKKKKILVIGDTFVDENWLMSKFDLYHSYNVGREHYISNLRGPDSQIISLCGVAGIIRILKGSEANDEKSKSKAMKSFHDEYDLFGISVYNPIDNDLMKCVLCPKHRQEKKLTPYVLSGLKNPTFVNNKRICPYGKGLECKNSTQFINLVEGKNAEKAISTNRLIRVYEGFGSDQRNLEYRYDWRLDQLQDYIDINLLKKKLKDIRRESVKAIIVVDHGYGVIGPEIVTYLNETFTEANWYVRCKLLSAEWLKKMCVSSKPKIKLIFTDEQLITQQYGVRKWWHSPSVMGRASLEILGDMLGLAKFEHGVSIKSDGIKAETAAVLFENDTAIAGSLLKNKKDAQLAILHRAPGERQPIHVGRSSVFFSSLIFWDLIVRKLNGKKLHAACEWALHNEYQWTKRCTKAWREENPNNLSGPFDQAIDELPKSTTPASEPPNYFASWDDWNQSSKKIGFIKIEQSVKNNINSEIQLWRAQGMLKDYFCPGGQKRTDINELIKRLYHYSKLDNPQHPFNCLFLSEPGWGKSTLANSLADHFDFEFLSFSVAQMATNQDLIDCLKVIVSAQNRSKKKKLIFIDEIDAKVQGNHVMGLLLGPIWDGTFKTEGNMFKIDPSIWVFASTKSENRLREESKGRDFLSRINGPIINLDFFGQNRETMDRAKSEDDRKSLMRESFQNINNMPLRTELVYHGVNILNKMFGPISSVNEAVLEIFYNTLPIDGIRSLGIFVSRFENITRGRVSVNNVPKLEKYPELARHILKVGDWPEGDDKNWVRVRMIPSDD